MVPETQIHRFSNGIRLATTRMPHMASASVGIWTEAGSRHELRSEHGMAHLTEHMLFKGTPDRSAFDISRQVERLGASLDAFTAEDHTCYHARSPASALTPLLDVMADLYQNPLVDPEELESEKRVIREEISMVNDQPAQLLEDLLSAATWGETHPLGRTITGTAESLNQFSQDSVLDFFDRNYGGKQTIISIAGQIDHDKTIAQVEDSFRNLRKNPPISMEPPEEGEKLGFAELHDREQAHLAIAFRAADRHDPDRFSQKILDVILGENMSSRLFQRLREQLGLCYEVSSETFAFEDTGAMQVYLALAPENLSKALPALTEIFEELTDTVVENQEIEEAINYCVGQSQIHFESVPAQMMWAGESLLSFDRINNPETVLEGLRNVTAASVQASARKLFQPGNVSVAFTGSTEAFSLVENWAQKPLTH